MVAKRAPVKAPQFSAELRSIIDRAATSRWRRSPTLLALQALQMGQRTGDISDEDLERFVDELKIDRRDDIYLKSPRRAIAEAIGSYIDDTTEDIDLTDHNPQSADRALTINW